MKRYNLMNDKFKDYGVSTIIAIDDIFNDINEGDKLEKFLPEVIDDLTGGSMISFMIIQFQNILMSLVKRILLTN